MSKGILSAGLTPGFAFNTTLAAAV